MSAAPSSILRADTESVDRVIAAALARDGRTTLRELAVLTGLSVSAVHARVHRMTESGVVRGYRAVLDHAAFGLPIAAVMTVSTRSGDLDELAVRIGDAPEVTSCYSITGSEGFLLLVRVTDLAALDALRQRLSVGLDVAVCTQLVLDTLFEQRPAIGWGPGPS